MRAGIFIRDPPDHFIDHIFNIIHYRITLPKRSHYIVFAKQIQTFYYTLFKVTNDFKFSIFVLRILYYKEICLTTRKINKKIGVGMLVWTKIKFSLEAPNTNNLQGALRPAYPPLIIPYRSVPVPRFLKIRLKKWD